MKNNNNNKPLHISVDYAYAFNEVEKLLKANSINAIVTQTKYGFYFTIEDSKNTKKALSLLRKSETIESEYDFEDEKCLGYIVA